MTERPYILFVFDRRTDPLELTNLAGRPELQSVELDMFKKLSA